jgi:hypothetical protein
MSLLKPEHNHPVVFRRSQQRWSILKKPRDMSEETFKRILLQRALIATPQPAKEPWGTYITRLATSIGMDPAKADLFLKGPFYRDKVRNVSYD